MPRELWKMSRAWAMPNAETFSIPPISALLDRYCQGVIVDPFARGSKRGTYTNDIDTTQPTTHHMDAEAFCELLGEMRVVADVVLFDPPYSPRQISECYKHVGLEVGMRGTQNALLYKRVRDALGLLLRPGGIAISFGWNSAGFGKVRRYEPIELMLVAHGGAHNDTIVVVERKRSDP